MKKQRWCSAMTRPPARSEREHEDETMMEAQPPSEQRQRRQQLARGDANITDPVTKIVGLILGSPEFQRQ